MTAEADYTASMILLAFRKIDSIIKINFKLNIDSM
jgi:hypothetical protein